MKNISLAILRFAVALHRKVLLSIVQAAETRKIGAEYIARKTEEAAKQARAHALASAVEAENTRDTISHELADLPVFIIK